MSCFVDLEITYREKRGVAILLKQLEILNIQYRQLIPEKVVGIIAVGFSKTELSQRGNPPSCWRLFSAAIKFNIICAYYEKKFM